MGSDLAYLVWQSQYESKALFQFVRQCFGDYL
jgi:hypothetical protein